MTGSRMRKGLAVAALTMAGGVSLLSVGTASAEPVKKTPAPAPKHPYYEIKLVDILVSSWQTSS
jgi:hypothetical protein